MTLPYKVTNRQEAPLRRKSHTEVEPAFRKLGFNLSKQLGSYRNYRFISARIRSVGRGQRCKSSSGVISSTITAAVQCRSFVARVSSPDGIGTFGFQRDRKGNKSLSDHTTLETPLIELVSAFSFY
jgi:hypothetical protein